MRRTDPLLAGLVLLSIGSLFKYLPFAGYGLDLTDEGFYLNLIFNSWLYPSSIYNFGFVYHPLYALFGGNLLLLRLFNVFMTGFLIFSLARLVLNRAIPTSKAEGHRMKLLGLAFVAGVFGLRSFTVYNSWLPSPSYNSLNLQGLLVGMIALLLVDAPSTRKRRFAFGLLGIAGWICFMAKPSTAAMLAMVSLFYLVVKKVDYRMVLLSVLTSLAMLVFSALIIDHSIVGFITRYRSGLADYQNFWSGHLFGHLIPHIKIHFERFEIYFIIVSFLLAIFGLKSEESSKVFWNRTAKFLCLIVQVFGALVLIFGEHFAPGRTLFLSYILLPSVAGTILYFVFKRVRLIRRKRPRFKFWTESAIFFLFPVAYAYGTANSFLGAMSDAFIFYVIGMLFFLGPNVDSNHLFRRATYLFSLVQLSLLILLSTAAQSPYRQKGSIVSYRDRVLINGSDATVFVSPDIAEYVASLQKRSAEAGFRLGDPIIDMTGRSPSVLYALGASAIGQPWTTGGYAGSAAWTAAGLDKVPCEQMADAWILDEPTGPRAIDFSVLKKQGISSYHEYAKVAEAKLRFYNTDVFYDQFLYKPINKQNLLEECKKSRLKNL